MNVEALGSIREGARLQGMLPHLEEYIDRQKNRLVNEVSQKLADGKLTPETAMYAWMEYVSLNRMLRSMASKIRVGVSAGEQYAKALEIGETNG
jgi:hypothetical protein